MSLVTFCALILVNESREESKTNNVFVRPSMPSYVHSMCFVPSPR